jgi:hypothetical protein
MIIIVGVEDIIIMIEEISIEKEIHHVIEVLFNIILLILFYLILFNIILLYYIIRLWKKKIKITTTR